MKPNIFFTSPISCILSIYFLLSSVYSPMVFGQEPRIDIDNTEFIIDTGYREEYITPSLEQPQIPNEKKDIIVIGFGGAIKNTTDFVLGITNTLIDFGELSPTNPVIRQLRLSLFNSVAPAYTMYIAENKPLTLIPSEATVPSASESAQAVTIPDTTCDTGSCTHLRSAPWTNTLTFGYGYRCEGAQECAPDFYEADYFRQFPSITDKKDLTSFLTGLKKEKVVEASLTTKINLPGTQQPGIYENTTTLLLLPGY